MQPASKFSLGSYDTVKAFQDFKSKQKAYGKMLFGT